MTNNPKISVIIPNFRHALFLDERIASVLNQTYDNFEIIILDDKSPDNSVEVINKYRSNPRVSHIVVNEENSGSTFKQWANGFKLSQGDFIWIAESDDVADRHLLEYLVNGIKSNNNIVLAFTNTHTIDVDGNLLGRAYSTKYWDTDFCMNGRAFVKKHLLARNCIPNASAAIFKKSVLENIEPSEYNVFKASGDRKFWALVALNGNVFYSHHACNMFRQHNQKVTPGAMAQGLNEIEDFNIYNDIIKRIEISIFEKCIINGYHYNSIKNTKTIQWDAVNDVVNTWKSSPFFNFLSYVIFRMARFLRLYN